MLIDRHWQQQYLKTGAYEHEIARGNVKGAYPFAAYGKLIASSGVTDTLVHDQNGTVLHVPASTGVQMSVVSTSVDDAAAGTGARTIVIEYLNATLDTSIELVTLNGLTPVLTQATDIRWVQAVYVASTGSGLKPAGQIDVTNGGVVYSRVPVGKRSDHSSFRRVPRGKMLYISSMFGGASSGSAATSVLLELVTTQVDGLDQQETGLFYDQAGIALQDSSTTLTLNMPLPVGPGQIVGFVATCDKAATITAGLTGWVEDYVP